MMRKKQTKYLEAASEKAKNTSLRDSNDTTAVVELFLAALASRSPRFSRVSFTIPANAAPCALHGFAGFFETTLYENIRLSTLPCSSPDSNNNSLSPEYHPQSQGMFSWFPIFLPVSCPITVSPGDTLEASVWRRVGNDCVWYEWCLEGHQRRGEGQNESKTNNCIQNASGASYCVKL